MKLISYNLHFGGKANDGNAWQRLIGDFSPDLILAQESFHPNDYLLQKQHVRSDRCVWSRVTDRKWGSVIYSRADSLERVDLPEFEGWVAGAMIRNAQIGGDRQDLLAFNIHAPSPGPYEPTVNRILDAIAKRRDGTPLILAGDFNITTARRHPAEELKNTKGEIRLLDRLRNEFGLHNASQALHPDAALPQTLRWTKNPQMPYHCDAVFVSGSHLAHLETATVERTGLWSSMSDHFPVVVTLR